MYAVKYGHVKCARLLAEKELKMQDNDGKTAFIIAVINGYSSCVKICNKERNIKDNADKTALMYAAENNNVGCVK